MITFCNNSFHHAVFRGGAFQQHWLPRVTPRREENMASLRHPDLSGMCLSLAKHATQTAPIIGPKVVTFSAHISTPIVSVDLIMSVWLPFVYTRDVTH